MQKFAIWKKDIWSFFLSLVTGMDMENSAFFCSCLLAVKYFRNLDIIILIQTVNVTFH